MSPALAEKLQRGPAIPARSTQVQTARAWLLKSRLIVVKVDPCRVGALLTDAWARIEPLMPLKLDGVAARAPAVVTPTGRVRMESTGHRLPRLVGVRRWVHVGEAANDPSYAGSRHLSHQFALGGPRAPRSPVDRQRLSSSTNKDSACTFPS